MFEFTLPIEEHRALFASRLVAVQIAVQSGEARNHLVGDDAIGFASFRRELIESGHGLDQDRRLTIIRPPTVGIHVLIIPHPMTRDTGQNVDFQFDRRPAQSICKAFRPEKHRFAFLQVPDIEWNRQLNELEAKFLLDSIHLRERAIQCRKDIVHIPDGDADAVCSSRTL